MFELEGFTAGSAVELPKRRVFVVADLMALQTIDVGELLIAYFASLQHPDIEVNVGE